VASVAPDVDVVNINPVPSAFGQIKRIACSDDLNSKYIIFVASMNVDVSLVAAQPSRSG
jgi:hypothetical protein